MKAEHRHELRTNELAEWLAHLPQWTKENLKTIILTVLLIVVVGGAYGWRVYTKKVVRTREQIEFTELLTQLATGKMQILSAQQQGSDLSFVLLQPARGLEAFAQRTKNDNMAALALIKRAEALRTELHYGTVDEQYLTEQTNKAKASYGEALQRCSNNPSLAAAAEFGLGLCEEELGDFAQAEQIYSEVATNPEYEGLVSSAAAKHRLDSMDDYKQKLVFKPAPKVPIQIRPIGANLPADVNLPPGLSLPDGANLPLEVNVTTEDGSPVDVNLTLLPAEMLPPIPEANVAPPPNSVSKDSEGNEPTK